ncbi:hypothetical protein, partial [Acinetobacter baumannii]|uniref:hypothetical protein n=1 Tax=Acinetobacter baumannii TaxID=470 RepID=UPI00144ADA42
GGDYWFPKDAIFEFNGPGKYYCYDVGSRGQVSSLNRRVSSGYYEFRMKKTMVKMDVRLDENLPARYFIDDYYIEKLTRSELILKKGYRYYFTSVD